MKFSLPKISDVEISQLRVFKAVVTNGGFSAAQLELGLSPSTISGKMTELETRLGLSLCRRGRGGFFLTTDGQRIFEQTEGLFSALESFRKITDLPSCWIVSPVYRRHPSAVCRGKMRCIQSIRASPKPTQFSVDGHIKQGKITMVLGQFQSDTDGPGMLRLQWSLLANNRPLSFKQGEVRKWPVSLLFA